MRPLNIYKSFCQTGYDCKQKFSVSKNSCIHSKYRPILGEYCINYPKLCHTLVLMKDIQSFSSAKSAKNLIGKDSLV